MSDDDDSFPKLQEKLFLKATLIGHSDWVTQIAINQQNPDTILSSSRDKTLIIWKLNQYDYKYGYPLKRLRGHGHFVSDVAISHSGKFALSGSWDKSMRLWDLEECQTIRRFVGHTNDVLSVAFSPDDENRLIVSGSRDKSIKLWNTLAQCKYTIPKPDAHTDWVSCVQFMPSRNNKVIASVSWDRKVKMYDFANCQSMATFIGHTGYLNAVTVSPDSSLCASGGKDFKAMLWDLRDQTHLYTFIHHDIINAICFSHTRYWVCVATGSTIKIWDLESKSLVDELNPENVTYKGKSPECTCLVWSADGGTLFAGYTDHKIRVWQIVSITMNDY